MSDEEGYSSNSPLSDEEYMRLNAAMADFIRVINSAQQTGADVTVLAEEAEAIAYQSYVQLQRYKYLVECEIIHPDYHVFGIGLTRTPYEVIMLRIAQANIDKTDTVIKNAEIMEYSKVTNYLSAIGLLYEEYYARAKRANGD